MYQQPPHPLSSYQSLQGRSRDVRPIVHLFDPEVFVTMTLVIGWTIFLVASTLYKMIAGEDSLEQFFSYLTNWNWTLNTFMFFLDFVSIFVFRSTIRYGIALGIFWLVNGVSALVFVLDFVLIYYNPNLLIEVSIENGYSLGFVLVMDRLFHVFPLFFTLLYLALRRRSFQLVFVRMTSSNYLVWYSYAFLSITAPLLLLMIYSVAFNIESVYKLDIPRVTIMGISFLSILFLNLIPFTLVYIWTMIKKRSTLR